MKRLISILDKTVLYFLELAERPVIEFTLIDLLIVSAMAAMIFYFVKYAAKGLVKYGVPGLILFGVPIMSLYMAYKKHQRENKVCDVCKNPLPQCVCPDNRGLSYHKRVKKYKRKQKGIKQLAKINRDKDRQLQHPVELKIKRKKK